MNLTNSPYINTQVILENNRLTTRYTQRYRTFDVSRFGLPVSHSGQKVIHLQHDVSSLLKWYFLVMVLTRHIFLKYSERLSNSDAQGHFEQVA